MSSALSGPQRRRLENTMSTPILNEAGTPSKWGSAQYPGLTNTAKIARSDEILAGRTPNQKEANLIAEAEYADPVRQALLQAANAVSRDAWNDLISEIAGRRLSVKRSGWQRGDDQLHDPMTPADPQNLVSR